MVIVCARRPWLSGATRDAVQVTDKILAKRAGATSLVAARGFLLLALAGAGYLATLSLTGSGIGGCGPGSGCHHVLSTRWAYWLGVPVSLPAFGLYLALLAATLAVTNPRLRQRERLWWQFIAGASLAVVGAGLWFVLLQYAVIGSWCKFLPGHPRRRRNRRRLAALRAVETPLGGCRQEACATVVARPATQCRGRRFGSGHTGHRANGGEQTALRPEPD